MKRTLIIIAILFFWLSPMFGQRFSVRNCYDDPIKTVTINEISDDGFRWEINGVVIQEGEKNTLEITPDLIGKTITCHWLCQCGSWKKDVFKVLPKDKDFEIPAKISPVSCNNLSDGKVILGNDKKDGFSYQWSDGGSGKIRQDLKAGTYEITATDSDGCKKTITVTVTEPQPILIKNITTDRPKCKGTTSGKAAIEIENPEQYDFLWEDGSTAPNRDNLAAGDYYVKINNGDKCSVRKVSILEAEPPTAIPTILSNYNNFAVSCDKSKDGSVQLAFVGGKPPYEITWDKQAAGTWKTGDSLPTFHHLPKGEFPVTIKDANGCVNQQKVVLEAPNPIHLELVPSKYGEDYHLKCSGDNSGEIHGMTSGGVGQFSYQWLQNDTILSTSDKLFKVSRGNYTLIVTDENGCAAKDKITMKQPKKIIAPIEKKGDKTTITVKGGTGDAIISIMADDATDSLLLYALINTSETNRKTFRPEPKTNYLIRVQDDNGCLVEKTFLTHSEQKSKRIPDDKTANAIFVDNKTKNRKKCSRCYVFGKKRTGFRL
jgi:hypothetical protein